MRGPLLALAGAAAAALLAGVLAIGFVRWRASEQALAFQVDVAKCRAGDHRACDKLHSACTKRSASACTALADLYFVGTGVKRSVAEAVALWAEACQYSDAAACLRAARHYEAGDGVRADVETARQLRQRACALGRNEGCGA